MKKFKIVGPDTTREFEIGDDEMITWKAIKITDYEQVPFPKEYPIRNEIITKNHD